VVVDRHRHVALGVVLSDDILVEKFLDLRRLVARRGDVEIMFQGMDGANICNKCIENGYKIIVENDVASVRHHFPRFERTSSISPYSFASRAESQ